MVANVLSNPAFQVGYIVLMLTSIVANLAIIYIGWHARHDDAEQKNLLEGKTEQVRKFGERIDELTRERDELKKKLDDSDNLAAKIAAAIKISEVQNVPEEDA